VNSSHKIKIEDVKPRGTIDGKALRAEFQNFLKFYEETLKKVENHDSKATAPHAWFGPMTVRKWHWLMGVHQRLHRKQMEMIAKQLS
jgi:hypothetical protein